MLTKEKRRAVLSAAFFVVVGIMIITSGAFASTSINAFASTSSDVFIVSSDSGAEVHTMELKAVKENGEARQVSGFAISIENVVSVERNGKVTVFSAPTSPDFTSAKITDTDDRTVDIPITDTGVISLAGYSEGIYTLDVIVDDRYAFESIVVIGPEEGQEQIINKQITEINNKRTDDPFKRPPSPPPCPPGYGLFIYNNTRVCILPPPPPNGNDTNGNDTNGIPNATDSTPQPNATDTDTTPQPNATDTTPPDIPPVNLTQSDGSNGGGANETIIPEPPPECPEGEQPTADGLGCKPIMAEEPVPVECDEGEELINGECQATPTEEIPTEEDEEDTAPDEEEEDQVEPEDDGGDGDGDEQGGDEGATTDEGGE